MQFIVLCPNCRKTFLSQSPDFVLPKHGGEDAVDGLPLVFTHMFVLPG